MNKYAVCFGTALGTDNNARYSSRILSKKGFGKKNLRVHTNKQATVQALFYELNWLHESGPDDTIVVYIGGHGYAESVILSGGNVTSLQLKNALEGIESEKQLILIDSCYSGTIVDDLALPCRIVISSALPDRRTSSTQSETTFTRYFLDPLAETDLSIQEIFYNIPTNPVRRGVMSDQYYEPMYL